MNNLNLLRQKEIFQKGSKTFYYSSVFFDKNTKKDVFTLYAFVRVVDDFVDKVPQDKKSFFQFCEEYFDVLNNKKNTNNFVIQDFVNLQKKYNFEQCWINDFLEAMNSDLEHKKINTLLEAKKYMHGSASVVGFMLSKIFNLKKEAYIYAGKLGEAFQYINFIRDIEEDNDLKRQYLPTNHYKKFGLRNLSKEEAFTNKDGFKKFILSELGYFYKTLDEAKKGFDYIPKRSRFPVLVASSLYFYTAKKIEENPLIVFSKKIKPSLWRILFESIKVFRNLNFNKKNAK